MAVATNKIDELIQHANQALAKNQFFEAERLAAKALILARHDAKFSQMATSLEPLCRARAMRLEQALKAKSVSIIDEAFPDDVNIKPGCYLVQPPLVGADARRFRLIALENEIPIAVVCREPLTQLKLCPIVALCGNVVVRTKIDPPDDLDKPDVKWLKDALEELGDWAVHSADATMAINRLVDELMTRLDAIPEHIALHQALREVCLRAEKELGDGGAPPPIPKRSRSKAKS